MAEKPVMNGASGWCLSKDHEHCHYVGCPCPCHAPKET